MKVHGLGTLSMAKGIKNSKMEQSTRVHMLMVNLKVMEHILGKMDRLMKVNGSMA